VQVQKGNYDLAFHYFQLALNQIAPGMNESGMIRGTPEDYFKQEKNILSYKSLIDKANAYRQLYKQSNRRVRWRLHCTCINQRINCWTA
jgi:hypothetical protein